ncbi:MAG TPA: triose-phosphate isomerase [Acidimicrobiales bacterium]|jgi:triosephosphate isomerase
MRKPLISGNWKMHHNHFEAIAMVQKLAYLLDKDAYDRVDVSVHPPFTDIRSVQTLLDIDKIPIALGAQHCHWEEKGAFTGEVSPAFLAKLEVRYCIVGHSERRQLFGQDDAVVERILHAILRFNMTPILCVGETLEEREAGETQAKVDLQVRAALHGVSAEQVGGLVIAYEPIWAIGTGRVASVEDAQNACAAIRALVGELHGADAASTVRIQYGGSVKPDNAAELMAAPDIDGALVGGASLEADSFAAIVRH